MNLIKFLFFSCALLQSAKNIGYKHKYISTLLGFTKENYCKKLYAFIHLYLLVIISWWIEILGDLFTF